MGKLWNLQAFGDIIYYFKLTYKLKGLSVDFQGPVCTKMRTEWTTGLFQQSSGLL
jgi:hypothetical protein